MNPALREYNSGKSAQGLIDRSKCTLSLNERYAGSVGKKSLFQNSGVLKRAQNFILGLFASAVKNREILNGIYGSSTDSDCMNTNCSMKNKKVTVHVVGYTSHSSREDFMWTTTLGPVKYVDFFVPNAIQE
jgi:hypothetical protein